MTPWLRPTSRSMRLVCLATVLACIHALAPAATMARHAATLIEGSDLASRDTADMLNWVLASRDNGSAPFVIVDKQQARLQVYEADGRLVGSTPVLLGLSHGDRVVPGTEDRPLSQMKREERVTPAGRFVARPGSNHQGEDIVWVDIGAGISMHRVRAVNPSEHRMERLSSRTTRDKRISYGCINLPASFYDKVLRPVAQRAAIIYVLPENTPAAQWFGFQ